LSSRKSWPCAFSWKNPSRTHECSKNEEFYYKKRERDYLPYWVKGGSVPKEKEKESGGLF
jgi:hypothetical protein